jgi:hypothetical protein
VEQFRGLRGRVARHSVRFFNLYRSKLNLLQLAIGFEQGLLLSAHTLMTSTTAIGWMRKGRTRTYVSTTEPLDDAYTPAFRVEARFQSFFQPTMVTDRTGNLASEMIDSGLLKDESLRVSQRAAVASA